MKKRIIAALTALVMVVTMIPANAFAATSSPQDPAHVAELIAKAAYGKFVPSANDEFVDTAFTGVNLNDDKDIVAAEEAYANLDLDGRIQIETAWKADDKNKAGYEDLLIARAIFDLNKKEVADLEAAQNAILAGEKLEADTNGDYITTAGSPVQNLKDAHEAILAITKHISIADDKVSFVNAGREITIVAAARTAALNDKIKKIFGDTLNNENANIKAAVAAINKITLNDVDSANVNNVPATYTAAKDTLYNASGEKLDLNNQTTGPDFIVDYAKYAKGFSYYKAIEGKVDAPKDFTDANHKLMNDNKLNEDGTNCPKATINAAPKADTDLENLSALAVVNGGNVDKAKALYSEVKAVYDKYAAMEGYKNNQTLNDMGDTLKALNKHIERYEEALALGKMLKDFDAKASLSMDDIATILNIHKACSASGVVNEYFKGSAAFDKIDYYLADTTVKAAKAETAALFTKLKAKAEKDATSFSPAQAYEKYGKAIAAEMNKVSSLANVDYVKDEAAMTNVAKLFNEFNLVATNYGITGAVKAKIPTFDVTTYAALIGDINTKAGASLTVMSDIDAEFAKLVTEGMYKDYILKGKRLSELSTENTGVNVSRNLLTAINTYLPTSYKPEPAAALSDYIKDAASATAIETAISQYNLELARLSEGARVIYDNAQALLAKEETTKYQTDAARIAYVKARLDAYKAIKYVQSDIDTLKTLITKLYTGKLTEAQLAANKANLVQIETVLAKEHVKDVFFGLKTTPSNAGVGVTAADAGSVELDPEYLKTGAAVTDAYVNYKYIKVYLEAKNVAPNVELAEKINALIKEIDQLKVVDNNDANLEAYNAIMAKYNALPASDKYLVSNYGKVNFFAREAAINMVKEAEAAMKKLGVVGGVLDAAQLIEMDNIKAVLNKYKVVLVAADAYDPAPENLDAATNMFKAPFKVSGDSAFTYSPAKAYFEALKIGDVASTSKIIKEELVPVYRDLEPLNGFDAATATAKDKAAAAKAIDTYNALSADGKAVLVRRATATEVAKALGVESVKAISKEDVEKMLSLENEIKTVVLDYAKIDEIKDQVVTGSAITPEVVVKDINGKVIPADKYVVKYNSNVLVGTAEVIVTPADDTYAGVAKGTFKIVEGEEVAAPTGLKVIATDNGILKVGVDKVEGVEGLTYQFFVKKIGNTEWVASKEQAANEVIFTGLTKNGEYEVKAVAMLNGKVSKETVMEGTVFANRLGNRFATMYKPAITKVTIKNGVAKVVVKDINYNKVSYSLGYKKASAKKFTWLKYTTRTVKTVKGLKKGVKYSFKVKYKYTSLVSGTTVYSAKWSKTVSKVAR